VAARDLPAGYRLAYWGERRPWRAISAKRCPRRDYALVLSPGAGVIDPCSHPGALLQYCSCPGPQERRNVVRGARVFGSRATRGLVAREYRTSEPVAAGTQLCIFYGHAWFEARGIVRANCGTEAHPAPRRRARGGKEAAAGVCEASEATEAASPRGRGRRRRRSSSSSTES
jgi:hypothetical protein